MCSAALAGGGAGNVGTGLGMGISEAMTGMRVAREDVKQGASPMADPRISQIYQMMNLGVLAQNQGPSTPVKYDEGMGGFVPNQGAGRPANIRYKGQVPQA